MEEFAQGHEPWLRLGDDCSWKRGMASQLLPVQQPKMKPPQGWYARPQAALTPGCERVAEERCCEEQGEGEARRVQRMWVSQFHAASPYITELPLLYLGLLEAPAWSKKQDLWALREGRGEKLDQLEAFVSPHPCLLALEISQQDPSAKLPFDPPRGLLPNPALNT